MHDIAMVALAWLLAFAFRFNFSIPHEFLVAILYSAPLVMLCQGIIFWRLGLYRGIWRFASIPDLKRILLAALVSLFVVPAVLLIVHIPVGVPRSVVLLNPILLVLMMGGSRFAYRVWKEHRLYGFNQQQGVPVILMGAGEASISLLKDLAQSKDWRVVGLLDDNGELHGRYLHGVKVLGGFNALSAHASALEVQHVIITLPSATPSVRHRAVNIANDAGMKIFTVPSFDDLMSGKVNVAQIRNVEVEDLLGREPVKLDDAGLHALLDGRVVLVSGAGGSIGSELCRQITKYQPSLLVCLELSEFALYKLEQELTSHSPKTQIVYAVGDVKNEKRLQIILQRYRPAIVFHAAAYKHVPLMENENVAEALSNNVIGTYTLAKACKEAGVEKFVLISTDKAVNPTNVMGASKRLAEMVCQGMQDKAGTRFVIVRFGNVLGSSGSVIPKFREQIAKGGPVTVTHPDVTRYFMSIPEAAQLVMQASLMGTGAEIFVLDMGDIVHIANLARDMIRLSGLQQDEIEIVYTGLRPGEKLYEELLADDEHTLPTPHEKLRIAVARKADKAWVKSLLVWIATTTTLDEAIIKQQLKLWVEEYSEDTSVPKAENQPPLASASSTIH